MMVLEDAVSKDLRVQFRYYSLGLHKEKIYERAGCHYLADPVSIVKSQGKYYFACYNNQLGDFYAYRLDRMDDIVVLPDQKSELPDTVRYDIGRYAARTFEMTEGALLSVKLMFHQESIPAIYDQFGEDILIESYGSRYTALVRTQANQVFWGWLFQHAGEVSIESPATLREDYKDRARKILSNE